ncbi:hypothetical protein GCM10007067_05700 [Lysobacter bugurensis]|uniref:GmrSD restriction endonucleases N-terminal domain-containing protein n=2 Tax=Cognatilysobacter bugurensis TaxID=543356 RepID=A0A918W5Y1_9GAMM|nr:hypothetical protein GCM10007067_05700 [Lysobacter bugurensis]
MLGLGDLLGAVGRGEIALPDFQRDFEWSSADVEQMLVTALNAWPAGSLLLLEGGGESFFRVKPFNRGPARLAETPRYIVLDGQQRITALFHAIYDRGDRIYYIDGARLLETDDLEESMQAISRGKWNATYRDKRRQAQDLIIPCAALESPTAFFEWRDDVVDVLSESGPQLRRDLTSIYQRYLSPLHYYELPAVVLERATSAVAVARIFERVNRLGQRLNTFDLMVARTYAANWNLRENWKAFGVEHPDAHAFFDHDGMAILQVVALRAAEDVRQAAVLKLSAPQVHVQWAATASALVDAKNFFQKRCFASSRAELPYVSLALLFAALAAEDSGWLSSEWVEPFFWARSFGRAYDVASNTRVVADYKKIRRAKSPARDLCATDLTAEDLVLAGKQGGRALSNALLLYLRKQYVACGLGDVGGSAAASLIPGHAETAVAGAPPLSTRVLGTVLVARGDAVEIQKNGFQSWLASSGECESTLRCNFLPSRDELLRLVDQEEWDRVLATRAGNLVSRLAADGVVFSASGVSL